MKNIEDNIRNKERQIENSLNSLLKWIQKSDYKGYDPYDALKSPFLESLTSHSKWARIFVIQAFKRFPFNLRPLFGINKTHNISGLALTVLAFCKLEEIEGGYKKEITNLLGTLREKANTNYEGVSWGRCDYLYQSRVDKHPLHSPLTYLTALVGYTYLKAFEMFGKDSYLKIAEKACNFILEDTKAVEENSGTCFCYSLNGENKIYNANMKAAQLFANTYKFTDRKDLLKYTREAVNYVIDKQREDGSWAYGISKDGKILNQVDFHQGFIICSLFDILQKLPNLEKTTDYQTALKLGAKFYRKKQFISDGRAKYSPNSVFPIDAHNQANGIECFSKLSRLDQSYLSFAKKIAQWTIENMQDPEGYFYFRKYRFFTNKIPYMRWSQAWMLYALSTLKYHLHKEN